MIKVAAGAGVAVLMTALAACSVAGTTASSPPTKPTTAPATPLAETTPTTPAPTARLTVKQAKTAYVSLADPYNAAVDAASRDAADAAPFSQWLADNASLIGASREFMAGLRSTRWPGRVQPYVTAMLLTDMADQLSCYEAFEEAQNYSNLDTIDATNQRCIAISSSLASTNADMIRSILGMPPI